MSNFRPLDQKEYDVVWDRFYDIFQFKPSIHEFPGIRTNMPSLKVKIKDPITKNPATIDWENVAIKLFTQITQPGERLYALDWQHECYDFNPREKLERNEFDEWIVPVLPNGDYYIFLTKNFGNVWFGHPWEQTITLVGKEIVTGGRKLGIDLFQ